METFTNNIREWHLESTKLKTWATPKVFLHWAHKNQRREVTTTGKGGHTAAVQNIYGVPPPSTRIASWNNKLIKGNCAGNEELKVWYGRTDTGQCSPYKPKLCSDGAIITNDCNNEFYLGTTQELICSFNKFNKTKERISLLELRYKFYYERKTCHSEKSVHKYWA